MIGERCQANNSVSFERPYKIGANDHCSHCLNTFPVPALYLQCYLWRFDKYDRFSLMWSCWKLDRIPHNLILFLNKAIVPKAIYYFRQMNEGGKFLKKLGCCVCEGGYQDYFVFSNWVDMKIGHRKELLSLLIER